MKGSNYIFNLERLIILTVLLVIILSCSSNDPATEIQKARQLASERKYQPAIIILKNIIKNDKNMVDARFELGKINLEIGNGSAAEKEFNKAEKNGYKDKDLKLLIGKSWLLSGKYVDILNKIDIDENDDLNRRSELRLLKVEANIQIGKYDEASKILDVAYDENSGYVPIMIFQARNYVFNNNVEKAQKKLDEINKLAADNIQSQLIQAELYSRRGEYEKSVEQYISVLKKFNDKNITPEEIEGQIGYTQALFKIGDKDRIKAGIRALEKRIPKHPATQYYEALMNYQEGNYDKALEYLYMVLKKIPDHYPSYLLMGGAHFAQANYEQANEYLTKYVNHVPAHLEARKLLGVTRLKLDRAKEAFDVLNEGVTENVEDKS